MFVKVILVSIFFLVLFSKITLGQISDEKIRQQVLENGVVDSSFVFGKWTKNGGTETDLKYLGQVTTKTGKTFKILTSIWFWGLSHRATSRILIFNARNVYMGDYYVSTLADLPTKLTNGELIFSNHIEDCDKKLVTTINLKNGLPKTFFRKCNIRYGDIYRFDSG